MTRKEFEELQLEHASSGMSLKSFLKKSGVSYTTYHYWDKKARTERERLPMAPIAIKIDEPTESSVSLAPGSYSGVILAFPNGVRAHFGQGSEGVLMEVLTKSMGHVLP
ncbi:MAG: hypothetical protein K2G90_02670 [Muribaculaceae bacterium]|nr:hypothetical protein [Muribaculaceae bacterium]